MAIKKKKSVSKKTVSKKTPKQKKSTKQFVVIRTYAAGVHCGYLDKKEKMEVVLKDARRLYRWKGANTLHEVSQKGVDEVYSRISEPVPWIALDAIEIIGCSPTAKNNLEKSRWGA